MKRKILTICVFLVIVGGLLVAFRVHQSKGFIKVAITQIVSHPGLDEVRKGIIIGLEKRGYKDGDRIKIFFRNANGDPSLTLPIAQDFVRKHVDVIVPITTPSALAAAKCTKRIPIVFAGVTDPVGVGLVSSLSKPGGNITGTSDRWPFEAQIELFAKLLPNMHRLGMLYKPGDDVSKIGIEAVTKAAQGLNIEFITEPVSSSADLYPTAIFLLRKVDALYTGMDNLVVENLDSILKAAKESNKPVLAGDAGSVSRGALASIATSMTDLGVMTGQMVADVIEGKDPSTMPIQVVSGGNAIVNREVAKAFNINDELLEKLGIEVK